MGILKWSIIFVCCLSVILVGYFTVSDIIRQQSFLHELDSRGLTVGEKAVREAIEQCRPYYKKDPYIVSDEDGHKQEVGRYEYLIKEADERMIPPGCYRREDNGVIFITHTIYYSTPAAMVKDVLRAVDYDLLGFAPYYSFEDAREASNRGQVYFYSGGICADEKLVAEYKKNPDIRWAFEVYDALEELDWACEKARENRPVWKRYQAQEESLQKLGELEAKIEKLLQNRPPHPTADMVEAINKLQKSHF